MRGTWAKNQIAFIIFLAGLIPRPLGWTERTLWRQAKGFLECGLGGCKPLPSLSSRVA